MRWSSRLTGVGGSHGLLQRNRAFDGVHGAGELHQNTVAHQLEDPAVMFGQDRLQNVSAASLQRGQRAGLVNLHQPAVADHIGGQNGGKATLDAFFGHGMWLLFRDSNGWDCMGDLIGSLSRRTSGSGQTLPNW